MAHKTALQVLIIIAILQVMKTTAVEVVSPNSIKGSYYHIEGQFGPSISATKTLQFDLPYNVVAATPDLGACSALSSAQIAGNVVLILRGSFDPMVNPHYQCKFSTKVYAAQQAGAVAAIIGNNVGDGEITPMYEDNPVIDAQITIPSISVSRSTFEILYNEIKKEHRVKVKINDKGQIHDIEWNRAIERWITAVLSTLMLLASISLMIAGVLSFKIFFARLKLLWSVRQRRLRVNSIPTIHYSEKLINDRCREEEYMRLIETRLVGNKTCVVLHNETCNVCLEDFIEGEKIRVLRCKHGFHDKCIKSWIVNKGKCPVCREKPFCNTEDTDSTYNPIDSLYV